MFETGDYVYWYVGERGGQESGTVVSANEHCVCVQPDDNGPLIFMRGYQIEELHKQK